MPLAELRKELETIDARLLQALAERRRAVLAIAADKEETGGVLRDRGREREVLARLLERSRPTGLDRAFVERIFGDILSWSLRLQQELVADRRNPERSPARPLAVAYQGAEGSYSQLAAARHFGARGVETILVGHETFRAVAEALEAGDADYGVLPIENTTAGSIDETYDLLARAELATVGEEIQEVDHCLIALEPVPLANIRRIYSQAQALAQCTELLASLPDCAVHSFADTALACRKIRQDRDLSQAAIASAAAAEIHGLHVLRSGVADQKENFTRFVVVAPKGERVDARVPAKCSLVFATRDEDGALLRCLQVFAERHVNLTKLESRPRPRTPWEYLFYVDLEGNADEPRVQEALQALAARTSYLKFLGCYPARTTSAARPATAVPERPAAPEGAPACPAAAASKQPYRLASRAHRREPTRVRVGNAVVGGGRPVVMAGPCAVESRAQVAACARIARELGADALRGGCFKPRTSPYAFQGLGWEGLELLEDVAREQGLPIVTEVLDPGDVAGVALRADLLQIGARNMQNFALLKEVGRVDRPVLLKRGMMASIEEWLLAAEYVLAQGNQQVILCERGIRTFETATRNTLDLSAIPVVRERTHLPIVVDPSHACGNRDWVLPLCEAALAAGADGLLVEIHPEPEKALCDGPQALTLDQFRVLMEKVDRWRNGRE